MAEDKWVYRSDGYYWIIKDKDRSYLQVAYYQQGRFYIAGSTSHFFPCELLKIGPRLSPPEGGMMEDMIRIEERLKTIEKWIIRKQPKSTKKREDGLYWIRLRTIDVEWRVAHWDKEYETWRLLDSSDIYYNVTKVGPRISPPKDLGEQDGGC